MMGAAKFETLSTSDVIRIEVEPNQIKTCTVRMQPVTDNSGKVFKIISIIQDISDEVRPDRSSDQSLING
ncbi:MAG: hypothetical protein ABR986_04480 [Methanomassiliicoccales archaeon]|jgi:hypothetical protein